MDIIRSIVATTLTDPKGTPFKFDLSKIAATHNAKILQRYDYDMTRVIADHPNSHISYGSEFRPTKVLHPLLHKSPFWEEVSTSLDKGAKYPLTRISNPRRLQDIEDALLRGNHKSVKSNPGILNSLVSKEVKLGFQLPTTIESIKLTPHACIAPYGLITQQTIDERGNSIPKHRGTHDQSFQFSSKNSVNDRVKKEALLELIYGDMLRRILHYIHSLRFHHPNTAILIGKYDFKAAYKRLTLWGHSAAACSTVIDDIGLISLRLTFGGSPCPFKWCPMAEIITDLANDLLDCDDWDVAEIHSPHFNSIPEPKILPDSIPFGTALTADVYVHPKLYGKVDGHIDDLIPVALHHNNNALRAANAVPLAMHILGRPVSNAEPVPRDELIQCQKLMGEGRMAEVKTVTGWDIDTRRFEVRLTNDKTKAWSTSIKDILKAGDTCHEDMETLEGRLNHAGYIIPLARHFLHAIRRLTQRCSNKRVTITDRERKYLNIWLRFLTKANQGISINNIVYRRPTHIRWDDSCPIGIGGVSTNGRAYRYNIPRHLQGRVSNNALEFLASMVGCWVDIFEGKVAKYSCYLANTDSSSCAGWIYNSNFISIDQLFHLLVAEKLATIFMAANSTLYSQHFRGIWNVIADSLSRDFHLTDKQLIALLTFLFPQQVPRNFHIKALPPTIISWINSQLLAMPEKSPEHPAQMPSSIGRGSAGKDSSTTSNSPTTNSSTPLQRTTDPDYSAPSPKQSESESFQERVRTTWQAERAKRPWTKWLRSSGQTVGATPAMVPKIVKPTASSSSSGDSPTKTPPPNNKNA